MRTASSIRNGFIILLLYALTAAGLIRAFQYHRAHRYDPFIKSASERYGVDPRLISAVIWRESGYKMDCLGNAGEIGLMQVREPAGRDWAKAMAVENFTREHLLSPETNILAGTWYLSRALKRWSDKDEPEPYALAEYNAGLTHARRWASMPGGETAAGFSNAVTFPTTRAYIRDIINRYRKEN